MEIVDLTRPLGPATPAYEGDPPVSLARVRSHESDGYQVTLLCMGSHSGTHLDAPRHFFADGATLDQYPADTLVRPGVVIDVRRPPRGGAGAATALDASGALPGVNPRAAAPTFIDTDLLTGRLRAVVIPPGGFLLLWTEGALLTTEGAEMLLEVEPGLVGTDAPSLDLEPHPVHRLLLGQGVLLAENLCNLERLGTGLVTCAFLPLAVVDADGAPVRAVAWR